MMHFVFNECNKFFTKSIFINQTLREYIQVYFLIYEWLTILRNGAYKLIVFLMNNMKLISQHSYFREKHLCYQNSIIGLLQIVHKQHSDQIVHQYCKNHTIVSCPIVRHFVMPVIYDYYFLVHVHDKVFYIVFDWHVLTVILFANISIQ